MAKLSKESPSGWGDPPLTKFLDLARQNQYANYQKLTTQWTKLEEVEKLMTDVIEQLHTEDPLPTTLFLLRTHGTFLGSLRMVLSCQVVETYPLLRMMLESALYALYISTHEDSWDLWLRRHESDDYKKEVRKRFRITNLIEEVRKHSNQVHKNASELYERTIDMGAHPNERSITTTLRTETRPETYYVHLNYLVKDGVPLRYCMTTTAEVGLCALNIFRLIHRAKFDLLGYRDQLDRIKASLQF